MTAETPLPRARYGMILPSSNRMAEIHANRFMPPGIAPYATRLRMTGSHFMPLDELLPKVAEACQSCWPMRNATPGVSLHGELDGIRDGWRKTDNDAIAEATGVQATTTAAATMAALEALDARRIVLVSPYVRKTREHELDFMAEAGIEVVGERNLGLNGSDAYCSAAGPWIEVLRDLKRPGRRLFREAISDRSHR